MTTANAWTKTKDGDKSVITPEYLNYILDMLKVHKELEESILRDITRRILKSGFVTDTAAYQAEKLTEAGLCYDDMLDKISKSTKKSRKEIKQAFDDAETRVFDYDETLLTDAGINAYEFKKISPRMKRIIAAALAKTTTDAINLTKTTANTVQSLYISACDLAHMQVISGAFDYNTAIKNAIVFAAKQGVKVVYPTGAVSSLDTAVRRSVLTGVNQTFAKITEMRAKEFDVDLMQTSAHIGARPEHAVWQGYIVSLSGRKGYLSLSDVGYGDVRGIFGAGCRHSWNMFFEGISHMQYTEKQLAEMRDATVIYNDEKMEVWRARDKQRAMERSIKSTKRELICFDEAVKNAKNPKEKAEFSNKFSALSVQLKRKEAKLADFTKQTGLKRDRVREQVFAAESKNGIKNFGKSVSQKAVWANKKELTRQKENDIINVISTQVGANDVHYIGKIDKEIYSCVVDGIQTDDVIITDERIAHIKERHPNDIEKFYGYMKQIIEQPEYIIESNKPRTALILKSFKENNGQFKTVMRLVTPEDNANFKNSIITFMKIDEKEWNRLIKNKKILYKSE